MAIAVGADKGTGFLVGLLNELGAMACAAVDPEGYLQLHTECLDLPTRLRREKERYGRTSTKGRNFVPGFGTHETKSSTEGK